ncbi:MAG: DUF6529 family protein [Thermoleophilia bacterium]|jgi:hypothetical protein
MFRNAGALELTFFGKSILATILLALAVLQTLAIGVARGWIGDFSPNVRTQATKLHHFQGYTALIIILFVAYNCVFVLGIPKVGSPIRVIYHALIGVTVLLLIMAKIMIVRVFTRYYARLPLLGLLLLAAVMALWITSAGWYFLNEGFS